MFARSEQFFAMLGLGPLGEGYSLIATTTHVPSMLDLDPAEVRALGDFVRTVRAMLEPCFGAAAMTEHGRVAACVAQIAATYEPHCLHAHRLVFPGTERVDLHDVPAQLVVQEFASFDAVYRGFSPPAQYLYTEAVDGSCQVAGYPGRMPRQIMRRLVAAERGELDRADWRACPGWEIVVSAQRKLGLTT